MNLDAVEKIANAILYEGYLLYPYRPSAFKKQAAMGFWLGLSARPRKGQ
jgi:hydrogenase maturation protease